MDKGLRSCLFLFVFYWLVFLSGCAKAESADIQFVDQDGRGHTLYTTPNGKSGLLRTGSSFVFRLDSPFKPGPDYSLTLSYTVSWDGKGAPGAGFEEASAGTLLVKLLRDPKKPEGSQVAWQLPLTYSFLGFEKPGVSYKVYYSIPIGMQEFSALLMDFKKASNTASSPVSVKLEDIRLEPLWFGFFFNEKGLYCTPFVARSADSFTIDVPEQYRGSGPYTIEFSAAELNGPLVLRTGSKGAGGYILTASSLHPLIVGALPAQPFPVSLSLQNSYNKFILRRYVAPSMPAAPIPADPALILDYQQALWRNPEYEVFQWNRFPEILIFDTKSYEVQDRLFKRLAFYVEKAGYRGRLASDEEIAPLHGWNAHDYRSSDLADFFTTAEKTRFPLNKEERELREILLAQGIIQTGSDDKSYNPGKGAIISISRESESYLRRLFMVHEAFHGLFFIDPEFQAFALDRWTHLDPVAKKFLIAYFKNRGYDTADSYLMKNELMAYCLQQNVAGAALYFGKTLPERLSAFPQHLQNIPEKDEKSDTWPVLANLFTSEARSFSDYVKKRWGLEAGRVWDIKKEFL